MEFKFDSQKDHNEATGETIIHLSNKQKQTQKEVDDHHKVHQVLLKKIESDEKDLANFKLEIDKKVEKKFDSIDTNMKSTDDANEKQYYENQNKFDSIDKILKDAIEAMKMDVKTTI